MNRKKFAYIAVVVAAASVTGVAQTKQVIAPPGLQISGIPFSPGVKAGDLYHIAGTMGTDSGGRIVAGPLRKDVGILFADIDTAAVGAARRSLDVVGHYARPDVFRLLVNDRVQSPAEFGGPREALA